MSIDSTDGRMYIGSRSSKCKPVDDINYFGSFKDKTFKPSKKIILKIFNTRKEAFKHEIYLHFVLDVAVDPRFANRSRVTTTGFSWYGQKHSKETIERLREAGKNMSKETREKIREKNKNKKLSPWHIQRLKEANLGAKRSNQTKEKIRQKALGRKISLEARQKIGEYNKGKWINRCDQSKAITLQNKKTKEVRRFDSQMEAVRELGLQQACVNKVALGKQQSTQGWILYND